MSKWTLSLTDLANQAEAFLEQVDRKAAESLQESDPGSDDENDQEPEEGNIFLALNTPLTFTTSDMFPEHDIRSEASHSSPEIVAPVQEVLSINTSDGEEEEESQYPPECGDVDKVELENKLMKQEMVQLTEEISMLSNKMCSYQEKMRHQEVLEQSYVEKLYKKEETLEKSGKMLRYLQDKESDLNDAVMAKDTQIGVLKVRLAEADAHSLAQTERLCQLEEDVRSAGRDKGQVEELKETVDLANSQLQEYKHKLTELQRQSSVEDNKTRCEITELSTSLHSVQQQLSSEQRKYNGALSELKVAKCELENTKKDLCDYKERATRVLQARERNQQDTSLLDNDSVEMLIQERNHMDMQYKTAKGELDELRQHMTNIEQDHNEELQLALDKSSTAESTLRERDVAAVQYNLIISDLKEELHVCKRELSTVRTSSVSEVKALKEQVSLERERLHCASSPASGSGELEVKLRSLTEVLLTKQSEVERLSSERSSLVLKLESLESLLQSAERKNNSVSVNIERESITSHSPYRNKRFRDAINSIDKFSIRLGVFLRRYPAARIMVIGYMLLLHSWVMVVLLTYSPEIHNH